MITDLRHVEIRDARAQIHLMFKWFRISLALLTLTATAAYAAIPGSHRALTPVAFGINHIGNGLYTDAPERRVEFEMLFTSARKRSEAFFGAMQNTPRIIICTQQECADTFDLKPRGLTLGKHLVFLGPKGVNEMILTHELAHIQLHSDLGLSDIYKPRIPAWFNEGLATYLSADPRVTSFSSQDAQWIRQAQSFRDWGRLHSTYDWPETYGAAKSLVRDLQIQIGDDGLRALIQIALDIGDFDVALDRVVGPNWP